VEDRATAGKWLNEFGPERIVLAFDVKFAAGGAPVVVTRGWIHDSGIRLWDLMDDYLAEGARHFLCTDVALDGTLAGPNIALYAECARRYPAAAFIASGGVSSGRDLYALRDAGAAAVVTGKALLDGRLTLEEIAKFSRDA
jgi:phosphoribosylformimino-5-aminoimidazole carboxamide ribotide isomerase